MGVTIRGLNEADKQEWYRLWRLYLEFYKTVVPEHVYDITWDRLLSGGTNEYCCLVAVDDKGKLAGIVHFLFHRHCWSVENVCYLQDLFVDKNLRGQGAGRALIEAVYAAADKSGQSRVYWLTQDFNATARRLYDQVAQVTPFIKYQRS